MNILLLTTHFNVGGISIYILNLAKHLKKNNINVFVASSSGDLVKELEKNNIKHIVLDIKTKCEFSFKMWKNIPILIKAIKKHNIDLLHVHTRVTQVLAFFVSKIIKVPVITTCHGFFNYKKISRKVLPCWGDKTIAISKAVELHLKKDLKVSGKNIIQIYNGVEVNNYLKYNKEKNYLLLDKLGIKTKVVVIGSIGRLSTVKGYKYLINAFKKIVNEINNVVLLILGKGEEESNLKTQIKELNLEKKVFFINETNCLEQYLILFDIFCLPSLNEGLGLSLMEAMVAGKPCIASNVGGIKELIVNEEDGLLVEPKHIEALKNGILRLIQDIDFRKKISEKAQKKAIKNFSIEKSVEQKIEVYRGILKYDGFGAAVYPHENGGGNDRGEH